MNHIEKEKLIETDIDLASIKNRVRHVFNQGYDLGYKEGCKSEWTAVADNSKPIAKNDLGVREFEEIVVEYPPEDLCIYPEYKGKPYFSIKYKEGNNYIIGYGTYDPKVFSRYLRDYFMSSVTPQEPKRGHWIWEIDETPSTPISPHELNYAGWVCSCCHEFPDDICEWDNPDEPPTYKFCPNCGAKMESEG